MSVLAAFIRSLKGQKYLILDTETTGLNDGEIVQIAIINQDREILLDSFIKPKFPIPSDATAIHGILDSHVEKSPNWLEIAPKILEILDGQNVIIYNAVYDRKMMHKSMERQNGAKIEWKERAQFFCAMEAFAEYFGDFNAYRGNFRWQKLITAAQVVGYTPDKSHTALSDCLTTWHVVEMLLKQEPENYEQESRRFGSNDYEY